MSCGLPCANCNGDCCGPVPITDRRLKTIRAAIAKMPASEIDRLAAQKRDRIDCGFYDTENRRCSIYSVRPTVCQLYGLTEGAPCHRAPELVTTIKPATAEGLIMMEASAVVLLSNDWKWR